MILAREAVDFILEARSPKGGGKGGGGSSSSSSGSSSKSKTAGKAASSSYGKSKSLFAPCFGCGGIYGLPVWIKILIFISICMSVLFTLAWVYYTLKEHQKVKTGAIKKIRWGKVIWSSFKVATLLGIVTWLYHACTGKKSKGNATYNKLGEGQQLQSHPMGQGAWMNVQPVESKYEPMSYPTYAVPTTYVGAAGVPAHAPVASPYMPPSTTPAPAPYIQPPPSTTPTPTPPAGAAASYYMPQPPVQAAVTPQPTGHMSIYSPQPVAVYSPPPQGGYVHPYPPPPQH